MELNQLKKIRRLIAIAALCACSLSAQAWTVSAQGVIESGVDDSGIFGTAGQNLRGLTFTQSISADSEPANWSGHGALDYLSSMWGSGPGFSDTITINGVSVTFKALSTASGSQVICDHLSTYGPGRSSFDEIASTQTGYTAAGDRLLADVGATNYVTAFVPGLDTAQTISRDTKLGAYLISSRFSIAGSQNAHFESTWVDHLDVNVSAVPEPETWSMLLAGLTLVAVTKRRKRRSR